MCDHLKEFLDFQRLLIIREAEKSERDIEEVAKEWIGVNSKEARNVFCQTICPRKGKCPQA